MMQIAKMPTGDPEIYVAVQGEGKTIGIPMIFTRLSTCNLACTWCDTFYTWNFDDVKRENPHKSAPKVKREDYIKPMTISEVFDKIVSLKVPYVNFTGGEPTIQQRDTLELMYKLKVANANYKFETETNGTVKMKKEYIELLDQINCSPKLFNSGNAYAVRNRPEVIQQIRDSGKAIFKFVITPETYLTDMIEVSEWQKQNNVPNNMIYLMSEGTEKERIIEGTRLLMDNFASLNFNVSTRLQVICYGAKRAT